MNFFYFADMGGGMWRVESILNEYLCYPGETDIFSKRFLYELCYIYECTIFAQIT